MKGLVSFLYRFKVGVHAVFIVGRRLCSVVASVTRYGIANGVVGKCCKNYIKV